MDLENIGNYIASQDPKTAIVFLQNLRDRCHRIAITPQGYPLRPFLGEGIRSVSFKSHIIFYTVQDDNIRIERILNGRMDYTDKDFPKKQE